DLGVVAGRSDTLAVMYAGRIVEHGNTPQILAAPAHPYLQALLESCMKRERSDHERLFEIPGQPPEPGRFPKGCAFAPRCPSAMKICTDNSPPFEEIKEQHFAACFLYSQT
ncbi:MAG: oligopeptide/dipeptide ABC transporter ATP-binding protein, partial [Planctomycetota bacterium]